MRRCPQECTCFTGPRQPAATTVRKQRTGSVYLAKLPLVGFEALQRLGLPVISNALALHEVVILQTEQKVLWLDYLPANPTALDTTARLLTGGSVEAVARVRELQGVPRQRCTLAGYTTLRDPEAAALVVQKRWGTRPLSLFSNDCRNHTAELLGVLIDAEG